MFARGNTFAATFDAERLEVTGPAVAVIDNLRPNAKTARPGIITADGSLAYVPTVSRSGRRLPDRPPRNKAAAAGRSARTRRCLFAERAQARGSDRRQRAARYLDPTIWPQTAPCVDAPAVPIWCPTPPRVQRHRRASHLLALVDTPGQAELLVADQHSVWPGSWSPDSKVLAYTKDQPTGEKDVGLFQLEQRQTAPAATGDEYEVGPRFSPDGRWLAYRGPGGGVYVMALGGAGGKRQISTEGGGQPVWSRDGHDLFYRTFGGFVVVPVGSLPGAPGKPSLLPAAIRAADGRLIPPG